MTALSTILLAIPLAVTAQLPGADDAAAGLVVRGVRVEVRLIDAAGRQTVSAKRTFRTGERFDLAVEPLRAEGWVYVLTEGPTGKRSLLYPERPAEHKRVRPGQAVEVPSGGDWFRFQPPAGTEKLRVIVSPAELDWMNPETLWKLDVGERLAADDARQAAGLEERRSKSIDAIVRDQQAMPVYRGTLDDYRRAGRRPASAGAKNILLVPPEGADGSQELMVVSDAADAGGNAAGSPPIVVAVDLVHAD